MSTSLQSLLLTPRPLQVGARIATLYEAEWLHIVATLEACTGNVSQAARCLGLSRQSLQRKLRRLPPPTLTEVGGGGG
jgi:ActR/RegA family two-component response regulator